MKIQIPNRMLKRQAGLVHKRKIRYRLVTRMEITTKLSKEEHKISLTKKLMTT